jgi:hypothetical protein
MQTSDMLPKYPIFIPSKGRWESRLTARAFDRIGVPYTVVVEPQEFDDYARALGEERIMVLPHSDKGLVVTRNWIWDFAQNQGYKKFWTFDDNIIAFWRWNKNSKVKIETSSFLRPLEDFTDRFINVPVSGMNYFMFIKARYPDAPIRLNTRVYSNMLIDTMAKTPTGAPYRNEGFYNDDTDLCLRILKDGNCTILFNSFLIEKSVTMTVPGGMTPHYQEDGRWKMAEELRRKHPDVTKTVFKWGRWQHQVDYRPFKNNKLILRDDAIIPTEPNEYGMKLIRKTDADSGA